MIFERIRGIPIVVFPGVFHPGLFLSSPLLLDAIEDLELETGSLVLDLGTGTGICAVSIAPKGARVAATDISPIAVRCARANVLINSLEDRVRVFEGDLFQPVEKQRFDLVVFNPPYYERKAERLGRIRMAWEKRAAQICARLGCASDFQRKSSPFGFHGA